MKWQPIKTAPRDGTKIILLVEDVAISGSWGEHPDCGPERYPQEGWRVHSLPSHGCGCCYEGNEEPEYWIPMPTGAKLT